MFTSVKKKKSNNRAEQPKSEWLAPNTPTTVPRVKKSEFAKRPTKLAPKSDDKKKSIDQSTDLRSVAVLP
jgi:hypothetical protein